MSGHSKWSQIKHKKAATDLKRGALFSKLLKNIAVAARGDPNPQTNATLRGTIDKARQANVPLDNIERARAREGKDNLESVVVEAYGPGGAAFIIEAATDNKNRFMMELRAILNEHGARIADPGSARWAFEGTGETLKAKITQPVSADERKKMDEFIVAVEAHDDVERAVSNAA